MTHPNTMNLDRPSVQIHCPRMLHPPKIRYIMGQMEYNINTTTGLRLIAFSWATTGKIWRQRLKKSRQRTTRGLRFSGIHIYIYLAIEVESVVKLWSKTQLYIYSSFCENAPPSSVPIFKWSGNCLAELQTWPEYRVLIFRAKSSGLILASYNWHGECKWKESHSGAFYSE